MPPIDQLTNPHVNELLELKKVWGWILALGVGLIVFGVGAINIPLLSTLLAVTVLGILMLAAGLAQIVSSFTSSHWSGILLHLLVGILYAVVGFFILEKPGEAAKGLTLLMAVFFFVSGLFRIVIALRVKFPTWGWTLLNGAVTLLLGLIIWRQFPESAMWLIGLLIGIEFIFNGWAWVMLAVAARNVPAPDVK